MSLVVIIRPAAGNTRRGPRCVTICFRRRLARQDSERTGWICVPAVWGRACERARTLLQTLSRNDHASRHAFLLVTRRSASGAAEKKRTHCNNGTYEEQLLSERQPVANLAVGLCCWDRGRLIL